MVVKLAAAVIGSTVNIYVYNKKCKLKNQNHQLSWWYALCLEGIFAGSPLRALNEIFIRIKFTGYC